jgi:FAD synthase
MRHRQMNGQTLFLQPASAVRFGRVTSILRTRCSAGKWEVRGEVVKGDQRGRELGFPTANFALGEIIHPAYGVYAARVNIEGQ